jgi:hypothetical protein
MAGVNVEIAQVHRLHATARQLLACCAADGATYYPVWWRRRSPNGHRHNNLKACFGEIEIGLRLSEETRQATFTFQRGNVIVVLGLLCASAAIEHKMLLTITRQIIKPVVEVSQPDYNRGTLPCQE